MSSYLLLLTVPALLLMDLTRVSLKRTLTLHLHLLLENVLQKKQISRSKGLIIEPHTCQKILQDIPDFAWVDSACVVVIGGLVGPLL